MKIQHQSFWNCFFLIFLFCFQGCFTFSKTTDPLMGSLETIKVTLKNRNLDWEGSGGEDFGNRYAILVGVDAYKYNSSWNLPFVKNNVQEMKKNLIQNLKFSPKNIVTITGEQATSGTILTAIGKSFYQKIRGKDNLILFYYSGHGFVNPKDKRQHFLTYLSSNSNDNMFTNTFSDFELQKKFFSLKKQLSSKVGIHTLFLLDACQSKGMAKMAPSIHTPKEISIAETTITSTKAGQYGGTNAKGNLSLFTEEFCRAIQEKSKGNRVEVEEVFELLQKRMERTSQQPQLKGKSAELVLFTRKAIPLRFEVYSALDPNTQLPATLKINNRSYTAPASLPSLEEGEYFLSISHPGYFPQMEKVSITPAHYGKTCRIYLTQEASIVVGRIIPKNREMAFGMEVAISGSFPTKRDGYHKQSQEIYGKVNFQLVVPLFEDGRDLIISQKGKVLRRLGLHSYTLRKIQGHNIRVYNLGNIAIQSTLDGELSTKMDFQSEESQQSYQIIRNQMKLKKYPSALILMEEILENIHKTGKTLEKEKFISVGYILVQKTLDVALENIQKKSNYSLFHKLIPLFKKYYLKRVPLLRKGLEIALKVEVKKGDFRLADQWNLLVKQSSVSNPRLLELQKELKRERISTWSRNYYKKGMVAFRKANLEQAEYYLKKVLKKSNDYYRSRILPSLKYLKNRLYLKYRIMGFSAYNREKYEKSAKYFQVCLKQKYSKSLFALLLREIVPHLSSSKRKTLEIALIRQKTQLEILHKIPLTTNYSYKVDFSYLGLKTHFIGGQRRSVREYRHLKTGMDFVLIPGGSFNMGSSLQEKGRDKDEGPIHKVYIKPFLMSKTEVTQEVWKKIMKTTPGKNKTNANLGSKYPVTYVTWKDGKSFCKKVDPRGIIVFRFPTESEWEYACRAGTTTSYHWGASSGYRSYSWNSLNAKSPMPVARKLPNSFGLYDMSGNVYEWCEDSYSGNYKYASIDGSSYGYYSYNKVCRGGAWDSALKYCRSANRNLNSSSSVDIGFRLVYQLIP